MRSASSNAVSAFARSPLFDAESPSMKCPHTLRGFWPVYCWNSFVASLKFPALYAASPSANDTGPTIFVAVVLSPLSPVVSFVVETGIVCIACSVRCDCVWVCDVLSVLEQPKAASAATSSAAVICSLRFICPPLLFGRAQRPSFAGYKRNRATTLVLGEETSLTDRNLTSYG